MPLIHEICVHVSVNLKYCHILSNAMFMKLSAIVHNLSLKLFASIKLNWTDLLQGDDEELLQPSFWQHLPNLPQPNVFLTTTVLFLRRLHGLPRLSFELRRRLHVLPAPNSSATRGASLDGSALHRLPEDPSSGANVSDTMRSSIIAGTLRI